MLKAFFKRLKHLQVRIKAADELGKLEDVRALGPLKEALEAEADPEARRVIQAAGKRIWQASQERTKPPSKHDVDEEALAESIVQEAMSAHNMPEPSLGGMLKDMATSAVAFGGLEGAALGALTRQARQVEITGQHIDTAEHRDLIHKAKSNRAREELQDEADAADEADETNETPDTPESKPIIRRLKPKED